MLQQLIMQGVAKIGFGVVDKFIDLLVEDGSNPLDNFDGDFIKGFIKPRQAEMVALFLRKGSEGLFAVLKLEAAKTETPLDDLKIQAIEKAFNYIVNNLEDWLQD